MRRILSVLEAHDEDAVDTDADAECNENGAVEETSDAPDDEQADERFSAAVAAAAAAAVAAAAAADLRAAEELVVLQLLLPLPPISPLPPLTLLTPLLTAYDCVRVVNRGEFSGSHSSGKLKKTKRGRQKKTISVYVATV